MKIILLGASGIIGSEIDQALSPKHKIVRAGRNGDVKVDYTDTKSVKAMFNQVGKFDALIAAVGGDSAFKPYDNLTDEDFNFGFQRKFMAQIHLVRTSNFGDPNEKPLTSFHTLIRRRHIVKAVGLYQYLPIENEQSLVDIQIDQPEPTGKDLLIHVWAISVNPVDTKVRAPKNETETTPRILGWDASGEVIAVGSEAKSFAVGDQVFYAGDITRPGSNSEYQLVDERIVGKKPTSLTFDQAAALPLTSITAWEALFDRLGISPRGEDAGKSILIIGGAGGVGSIAIQLAKQLAKLNVVATASRPESSAWVKKLGADHVVNHRNALDKELSAIALPQVDYIFCLNNTAQHWSAMANAIAPQGRICSIVETQESVDLDVLKSKSATFVWEFMFTRSMYQTADMIEQQLLLTAIATLIDEGKLVTTINDVIRPINAANLRKAHALVEQGNTIGKVVLADWA